MHHCPALLVAAPASGQGKTLVTAALARRHRLAGRRVRVFKTGPDFLDPMILERASGQPVHQLDLFMVGEARCRQLLFEAAERSELILIEGVMGLFDGQPSSADLAALFSIPVLAVINASAMAQTFGAIALGLASYRKEVPFAGVLANRVAGERHAQMLKDALPSFLPWAGFQPCQEAMALPERHLGLVQASEIGDLDARIDLAAESLQLDLELPQAVAFSAGESLQSAKFLDGVRIAIARDAAFSFIYPANLELLAAMGAQIRFFSPIADAQLPDCDALWLPGGYPELHLDGLTANGAMRQAIRTHFAAGRPILAECGGMLYLAETLMDVRGKRADMVGLLPARATMQPRLVALGLQAVEMSGEVIRGHTFHHSRLETALAPAARATNPRGGDGEAVYRVGNLTASYVHFYFPSNPRIVAQLFRA